MATIIGGNQIKRNDGSVVTAEEGGWYDGRRLMGGKLLDPGEYEAGKQVSNEVIAQTNPNNVSYVQQQRISADKIQAPVNMSLPSSTAQSEYVTGISGEADRARQALQSSITQQKSKIDSEIEALRAKEKETLDKVGTLVTPFREDLETKERERLHINENFEANQELVNELDTLLTEGNDLIRQAQEVTGLAAVRNPRIQKAMDDVAARAGVIQAVINARNGQISVAENMIDRSVAAIVGDRMDQISYYETILNLNRQDILNLDSKSQKLAEEQLNIKKSDLARAEASVDYVKQLLIDPNTAALMGEGGVKLNDSVEEINRKVSNATYSREVRQMSNEMVLTGAEAVVNPNDVPKDELQILTDSRGQKHYYRVDKTSVGGGGTGTASERAVDRVKTSISNQGTKFPDAVVAYANQMTLSEIYSAYNQSAMGQKWGTPQESSNEIALLYKWARGEITEAEYRVALGG